SDVHRFEEIDTAAKILDVVQVPAFLCRQTDFVLEIAKKAQVINVKKGQFLAPWDAANIIEKVKTAGNENIMILKEARHLATTILFLTFVLCQFSGIWGIR